MQIINAIAALVAWFAAKQVDDILGKWVAYFTIAFQNAASERAKRAYRDATNAIQGEVQANYGTWDEWRKKVGIIP